MDSWERDDPQPTILLSMDGPILQMEEDLLDSALHLPPSRLLYSVENLPKAVIRDFGTR